MIARNIKRRLLRARIKLSHTIQSILHINRTRKHLPHLTVPEAKNKEIDLQEQLRILNKTAAHQAGLIRRYEEALKAHPQAQQQEKGNRYRAA